MAGVKKSNLEPLLGFPAGVVNTTREREMPRDPDTGQLLGLREAENIDLSVGGKVRRRAGYELELAGDFNSESGWSDDHFPFALLVKDNTLQAFNQNGTFDALQADMAPGLPVSYARINDAVSWTNGVQCGQVTVDGVARPWACPNPPTAPTLTATADGALFPGFYQVVLTFLDQWGRESGGTQPVPVTLDAQGAIVLENIAQPPAGGRVRIYCTSGNDGVPRAAVTIDAGITEYLLAQLPKGRPCDTGNLIPLPPGQLVAYGAGRQFVAAGREVLFSPALRYGLFDPRKGRVRFVGRIQMLAYVADGAAGAGLYVSDTKCTYFLAGANPADWVQERVDVATMPGRPVYAPGTAWGLDSEQLVPVWHTVDGRQVLGLPGGKIQQTAKAAAMDVGQSAAILYRKENGEHRFTTTIRGSGRNTFAVRDALIVHEYPHE